jgi:hypothetical protein
MRAWGVEPIGFSIEILNWSQSLHPAGSAAASSSSSTSSSPRAHTPALMHAHQVRCTVLQPHAFERESERELDTLTESERE